MDENDFVNDFIDHFAADAAPKIRSSAHVVAIAPEPDKADLKAAMEIGYSILIDKPLVIFKPLGAEISKRLLKAADKVIEVDFKNPENWDAAREELARYMLGELPQ